nr:uncharacterized protein LOC109156702 [Ipomoea batatas]
MAQRCGSKETCVAKRARVGESGQKFESDVDNGIVAVREKLMEGLEDEERRRVVAVDVEEPSSPLSPVLASTTVIPVPPSQTTANSSRPWNLTQCRISQLTQ